VGLGPHFDELFFLLVIGVDAESPDLDLVETLSALIFDDMSSDCRSKTSFSS
jgi:hypothetical protein